MPVLLYSHQYFKKRSSLNYCQQIVFLYIEMEGLFGDCCHWPVAVEVFKSNKSNGSVDSHGIRIFVLEYSKHDEMRWKSDEMNLNHDKIPRGLYTTVSMVNHFGHKRL